MSIRYLDLSGAVNFWTNIKNYILSKIPTKTSELTNDSGFLTQHQSLSNYVTLNSEQTITGKKLFTNSTTKVNSVNTFTGSTQFIDLSTTVPRGAWPAEDHRVGRVYIGDSTSYNGSWFIIDPAITSTKAYYRMVTTNPDNTDSTRFSITWDSTETGARCRKNVSTGDLLPYANNTYNLGSNNQKWDIGYIHNLIGSNKENASEDANNYYSTTSGSHMTFYTTTNGGTKLSNVPAAVNTHLESRTIRYLSASDWNVEQICHNTNGLYYRKGNNNGWGDWKTFAFTDSNITGKASNVTGTVAIANGGTGATSRLNAIKNLTNEAVGTPTHFLAITTNWGKAGYTTVAQAKTVLGITGDMGSHSDSEYVHKTGNETISGEKTFGNGTLIVDNGTGNNVHGEIKLNGTRPVYINADNSEDGLFANTACGMSIILNDSSKSIHIGGYTTNSSGRKLIKTADKAPYLTLGTQEVGTQILVPENDTADSTFSITSTLKYASGASAKSFTVKFKQGDDGSSGVFPVANNKTDLGLSGNRWKNVYATNYYYGADAVEFSTKFVTTDTNQVISGAKTFSSTITGSISGNASTATEFSANKDVTLTGDVTGSASSKAGWSVSTTLSNSGVTAGTYGPSADVTGNNNATISVPEITVDAKGRVTAVTNRTYTSVNTDSDKKVYQYYKSDNNVYRLLFSNNSGNTATSNVGAVYSGLNNSFYVNPSTGSLYATKLYSGGTEVSVSGHTHTKSEITDFPTNVSAFTNDSGYLTSHQSLSNYVTLNTAQEITNTKTFKDATTVRKLTSVEAGNVIPSSDKLISDIWQDKNGKELGRIYFSKTKGGNTALIMRAGDYFSESEGVYSLNASGTNRRAELHLYSDSSGNCCIKPVGLFSTHIKPLNSSVYLGDSTNPFGRVYANAFEFCNASLLPNTDVQTAEEHSIGFYGQNNTPLSYITFQKRPNLKDRIAVRVQTAVSAYKSYCFDATCFYPEASNNLDIGSTTNIFKNIYCNNYYKGTTAFGDIVTHNASEFLTEHPSITLSSNTTSTASPAHGGTFTCIDSVTQDTNGHITKVNTKTVTLPSDNNTDTKVTQTVTNDNAWYPLLIANTASASHTGLEPTTETDEVRKAYNINVQARYGFIYARNSYNHDNLKGSVAGGNRISAAFYGSTYDGTTVGGVELGRVDKYGNRYSRLFATSHITDGALAPDGTAVAATFDVGVIADGTKYLNTSAGWHCNVYPTVNNTRTLGTSSLRWKECYSNAYYLGTTAFGDIVTHNASEFLTSHQSLSSCVKNVVTNSQTIKSTAITRGTAPSSAQTFGISFTDNNNKYIGNIYGQFATDKSTYVGLYAYKGSTTSNGDNASVRVGYDASGNAYTYAPTPATTDNSTQIATTAFVKAQGYLTAHQSLANYVTTNTDQSISGIKSHSKHISILGDYVGNESSTNGRSCLYLKANRDTDGKSGLYVTKFRQNVAQGSMGNSDVVFLSHDILENETRTNAGFVESYSNWTNNVPGGMSIYSSIATRNLGTSAKPWTNAYITNLNLNGHAFDPTSTSGNIGDIVFAYADATGVDLSTKTTSGSYLRLLYIDRGESMISETSSGLTGTWKFLGLTPGYVSAPGVQIGGVWKRIA